MLLLYSDLLWHSASCEGLSFLLIDFQILSDNTPLHADPSDEFHPGTTDIEILTLSMQ